MNNKNKEFLKNENTFLKQKKFVLILFKKENFLDILELFADVYLFKNGSLNFHLLSEWPNFTHSQGKVDGEMVSEKIWLKMLKNISEDYQTRNKIVEEIEWQNVRNSNEWDFWSNLSFSISVKKNNDQFVKFYKNLEKNFQPIFSLLLLTRISKRKVSTLILIFPDLKNNKKLNVQIQTIVNWLIRFETYLDFIVKSQLEKLKKFLSNFYKEIHSIDSPKKFLFDQLEDFFAKTLYDLAKLVFVLDHQKPLLNLIKDILRSSWDFCGSQKSETFLKFLDQQDMFDRILNNISFSDQDGAEIFQYLHILSDSSLIY